jgi:hypothetical protein
MTPRRLQAPATDGGVLAQPPLADVGRLLERNSSLLSHLVVAILGRPLAELRNEARAAVRREAETYLLDNAEPLPEGGTGGFVLAGHQPELFHPGVWVKNFALCGLARQHGLTPLNLVVDNDTLKASAIRVPAGAPGDPAGVRLASVPFDRWEGEIPYEERPVLDEERFGDFPRRVAEALAGWDLQPLVPDFWTEAAAAAGRTRLLGERFAAARRALERRWGCHNLEVPLSRLCRTGPFAFFAVHLLQELPRFRQTYNDCLGEYRRLYRIRSRHHPVPDLSADGDWLEAPFWAWRSGQGRRGRLLVRARADRLELRAGADPWPTLPRQPSSLTRHWVQLGADGYRVRPRALTTTLFARLFVGELFIHGIGGAKYDELTDEIIRRFYGVEPPGYVVLSATLRLPLPPFPARREDRHRLARLLRDQRYNPQRHLDETMRAAPAVAELLQARHDWLARRPATAAGRRERFVRLRELTERLARLLAAHRGPLQQQLADCEQALAANAILQRRDYSFCLFPEALVRPFCTRFLQA